MYGKLAKKLATQHGYPASKTLTAEQEARVEKALHRTWNQIACDYLELFPRRTCKGSDVASAVPDYLYIYAEQSPAGCKEVNALFNSMSNADQNRLLAKCFPANQRYSY